MQASASLQVLPAISDQVNLYLGLNTITAGRSTSTLSSPGLIFNPSANSLSVAGNIFVSSGGLRTTGNLNVNGAIIQTDAGTGAVAIVPSATSLVTAPSGLVVNPDGTLGIITARAGGFVAASDISAVANTASATGGIASAVRVYNYSGTVTTGTGTIRWYPPTSIKILTGYITSSTPPTTAALIMTLNRNGVAVATISLGAGASNFNSAQQTVNVTATTTDYFTVDVSSAGGAANATLSLVYLKTA